MFLIKNKILQKALYLLMKYSNWIQLCILTNKAAIDIFEYVSLYTSAFLSVGKILKIRIGLTHFYFRRPVAAELGLGLLQWRWRRAGEWRRANRSWWLFRCRCSVGQLRGRQWWEREYRDDSDGLRCPNNQEESRRGVGMKLRTSPLDILNAKVYFKLFGWLHSIPKHRCRRIH